MDVQVTLPSGRLSRRVRRVSPAQTRNGALDYEMEVRRSLLGTDGEKKEVEPKKELPTVVEFSETFMSDYAVKKSRSDQDSKRMHLRAHIKPHLGTMRLDEVDVGAIDGLIGRMLGKALAPKTVNNVLLTLNRMLKYAVERKVLDAHALPRIGMLKVPEQPFAFFDFEEAERLIHAAKAESEQSYASVLFPLDTGARMGEQIALEWSDLDLKAKEPSVTLSRSDYKGVPGPTKGKNVRTIPLTARLAAALKAHRHLRRRVFSHVNEPGTVWTKEVYLRLLPRLLKKAGVPANGACCGGAKRTWHSLRHTFASHLVMKGADLKAVQVAMGHAGITTTMRYAHLAPGHLRSVIRLLDTASCAIGNGTWEAAGKEGV